MAETLTGWLQGNVITLDHELPFDGQRVRVQVESASEFEMRLSPEDQASLWQAWVEQGPQGPLEVEGDADFP